MEIGLFFRLKDNYLKKLKNNSIRYFSFQKTFQQGSTSADIQ